MQDISILCYGRADDYMTGLIRDNFKLDAAMQISGALDGVSDDEIRALASGDDVDLFAVPLSDGSFAMVDHDKLDEVCTRSAAELKANGAGLVFVFCTAPWYQLESVDDVLVPFRLLENNALTLMKMRKGSKLGVMQPAEETKDFEIKHWLELGVEVTSAVADSFGEDNDAIAAAAKQLEDDGAGVVVMDCLAYTESHYEAARAAVDIPVILPMSFLASVVNTTCK